MSPDETKTNGFLVLLKESILGSYPTTIWGTWIGFIGQPESYTNSQNLGLQNDGILYQNVIEMQRLPCPNPLLACVNVRFYGQLKSREAICYSMTFSFFPQRKLVFDNGNRGQLQSVSCWDCLQMIRKLSLIENNAAFCHIIVQMRMG